MAYHRASCRAYDPRPVSAAVPGRSVARNAPRYGNLMAQLQHVDRAEPGRLRGAAASERQLVELVEHPRVVPVPQPPPARHAPIRIRSAREAPRHRPTVGL